MMDNLENIVILIDADNTQINKLEAVFQEISLRGRIVVRRAYGNWQKDTLKNWKGVIQTLAIKAEQQFDYVPGKNATDMALVIDAIDLLHIGLYDGFVLISSDSDFTPLAIKLRESGKHVIGVGEQKTPTAFRNACDEFIFLENLKKISKMPNESEQGNEEPVIIEDSVKSTNQLCMEDSAHTADDIDTIHEMLKKAWTEWQDGDEFVNISSAGTYIKRVKPEFDAKNYGYSKLPQFIAAFPEKYEIKRFQGKGTVTIVAYKCLPEKP